MRGWVMAAVIGAGIVLLLGIGMRALLRGRRVPTKAKLAIAAAVVWLLSPLDAIPDVVPALGILDDVVVLVAAVRYFLEQMDTAPAIQERLAQRRPIDVSDWRIADDPPDSR